MKRLFCFLAVLLSTHYLQAKASNQYDEDSQNHRKNCYLMMEPAAIEEAGKALKRELGITEEKTSLAQTSGRTSCNVVGQYSGQNNDRTVIDDAQDNAQEAEELGLKEEQQVALPLEAFRAALDAYPDAKRLVIDPNTSAIRPWSEADSKNKGKNEAIIAALKTALQADFPEVLVEKIEKTVEEELPQQSMWEKLQGKPALSTETLQRILAKVNDVVMAERTEHPSFTLQHFRNALAHPNNQGAQRLIISGEGTSAMIIAQAPDLNNASRNQKEESAIRKTLKRTLESEGHRKDFVHELISKMLPYSGIWERARKIRPPLNFEKLTTILQEANDAMANIKLLQATRSLAPISSAVTNRAAARKLLRDGIGNFFNRLGIQNDTLPTHISDAIIGKNAEEIATQHAAETRQAAWEQSETEKIIRSLLHHGRKPDILKHHYHDAESVAIAAEAAHNQAMEARWDAEKKEKFLNHARLFFEKIRAALNEKRELSEFDESTLNKISQGADLTSVVLGIFNLPFVSLQGIATAVSTFATFADQRLTIAEAQKAYQTLQAAIQKAEVAAEGNERVREAATTMHAHAEEIERLKKKENCDETMHLSTIVRPPIDVSDDVAWRTWATELACEADAADVNQTTTTAYLLYKQGKKNPAKTHELISTLWGERVALSQQEAQRLEEETSLEAKNLQQLFEKYKIAQEKEMKAEANAVSAKNRLEAAAQAKSEWLKKRDQLRHEETSLEDQLPTNVTDREGLQRELDTKRSELGIHQAQKKEIDATYQTAVEEAKHLTTVARIAHADAFEKFKTYDSAKKRHERHITRFKAAAEDDQDQEAIAIMWKKAAERYYLAVLEQTEGNREAAEAYCKSVKALEAQAAALARGDTTAAELHNQIASAWGQAARTYSFVAKYPFSRLVIVNKEVRPSSEFPRNSEEGQLLIVRQLENNRYLAKKQTGKREADEAWRKSTQAYEAQAAVLVQQLEALARGDTTAAELHNQIASAWKKAAELYDLAALEQTEGNREAAEAYFKSAQACEAQAAALARGDTTAAELHNQIASAWTGVGRAYNEVAQEQTHGKGSREAAEAFRKSTQAYEAQAAALVQQLEAFRKSTTTPSIAIQPPSQQTIPVNRTTGAQSDHFIQSAPPQEVSSKRLPPSQQEKPPGSIPRKKEGCIIS